MSDDHKDELRQLCEDQIAVIERLSDILTWTANALKGKPEPNTAHSWHDLPELAVKAMAKLQARREAELRQLETPPDPDAVDRELRR